MKFANATKFNRKSGERSGGIRRAPPPLTNVTRKRHPQTCHPDRRVPGFPATRHSPPSTYAAFLKESRMKFANATNINRKSGAAKWSACFSPLH
jgi:hypothetical protein